MAWACALCQGGKASIAPLLCSPCPLRRGRASRNMPERNQIWAQGELTRDKFNLYFEIIVVIYKIWVVKKIYTFWNFEYLLALETSGFQKIFNWRARTSKTPSNLRQPHIFLFKKILFSTTFYFQKVINLYIQVWHTNYFIPSFKRKCCLRNFANNFA